MHNDRGHTRLFVITILLMGAGLGVFYVARSGDRPVKPATTTAAPATSVVRRETSPPPVEPRDEPAPAPRRRASEPKAAAPSEPAAPTTGTLRIDSDVPGASVFLDRVYVGTTPVTANDVAPGRHQVNASVQGQEGISESVEVGVGERDLMLRFKEVRLDAAIDVVHKHGVGSCRGRLVATPQGLRYETTNKGDAFSASVSALEIFEVDYLKKNLRIKPKGGKTYNFTDPEDNADPLFVFHRDVDKARQKLTSQ